VSASSFLFALTFSCLHNFFQEKNTKQFHGGLRNFCFCLLLFDYFSDMNKYEQIGAEELLSMLNDGELMSVKDTVTKSMVPANTVRE